MGNISDEEARDNSQFKTEVFSRLNQHYRDSLDEFTRSAEKHSFFLDRSILTISSGAIAVFFSFNETFFSQASLIFLQYYVKFAAVSFASAIAFVLLSFAVSQKVFKDHIDKLNTWYNKRMDFLDMLNANKSFLEQNTIIEGLKDNPDFNSFWKRLIDFLNVFSMIGFFGGISFSIFIIFSLS